MRSWRQAGAALAVIGWLLGSGGHPAGAQPSDDLAVAKQRARDCVEQGARAQERGDYDAAIAFYQQAYDLLPHPALFFNMGQAHRLAGRIDDALAMYRRYLSEVSTGSLADQTRAWIDALERETETAPPGDPIDPGGIGDARAPGMHRLPPTSPVDVAPAPAPAATADRPEHGLALRIGGIAVAATGFAAVAVGGFYGLEAKRLGDELNAPRAPYDLAKYAEQERAERRMVIGLAVGGALVAGGVALYVVDALATDDSSEEHRGTVLAPRIAPSIGAGQAGISLTGWF